MILLDANILIYAHVASFSQHERARTWLDAQLNSNAAVGFPWQSLLGFLRLVTNPRVFPRPAPMEGAWRQVTEWLDCQAAWVPQPTERHREILGALLIDAGAHANLVPDAHLAALAIEHGLVLCSTDAHFARFSALRWQNPLAG